MRLLALVFAVVCMSSGVKLQAADAQPIVLRSMNVETYRVMQRVANNAGWGATAYRNYLIGLFEGLLISETGEAGERSSRLFCLPPERTRGASTETFEWLEAELNKAVANARPDAYVARIFVAHLTASYPCKD